MSGCVGQMDAFDSTVEDWATYVERVEQYCLVNDIGNERKVAVLLSVMGTRIYNLLHSLTAPVKPAEKTFKEIVDVLQMHLNPKPLIIAVFSLSLAESTKDSVSIGVHGRAPVGSQSNANSAMVCLIRSEIGLYVSDKILYVSDVVKGHITLLNVGLKKECRQCHRKGHIQKMCKAKPTEKKRRTFANRNKGKIN